LDTKPTKQLASAHNCPNLTVGRQKERRYGNRNPAWLHLQDKPLEEGQKIQGFMTLRLCDAALIL